MTLNRSLFYFLLSLLWTNLALAQTSGSEKLNAFVQQVGTFQAQFQQVVLDPQGNVIEEAQGQFQLQRPGKFRWDYRQPYPQQIIADGQNVWFYDVDLEQVTVKSQLEALAETPATLLSGDVVPEDKYQIRDVPSDDGLQWVELIPKEADSNFQTVTLAFDNNSLQRMIMQDSFDQRTRLVFSQVKENVTFAQDAFEFTPPAGVDVVGDTQQ
ncbi:outer membrane lipoprotein chaperone LolA [Methylophaga sp. OBS4]|uniref:outer membrane lipoprotein chaperone LolA n=1 Tax=Methylophaga sp. OBS4 TaxID=2991935 RepID=UPI00224D3DD9|nr:outer membrane lipoprotein chaperone LolA [Methylophaga sp. OBS4]MCX4187963.1 outer membrane lipoprotein chaperone LolA [Methylophaga sp. OBS4]